MGVPVAALLIVSFLTGVYAVRRIKGSVRNFFVGGNVLPVWVLVFSLCGQAIELGGTHDSTRLGMTEGFWSAMVLPVGVGLSLIVEGLFFAVPLHRLRLLSLPDFFKQRYNRAAEVIVAVLCVTSFSILVAGNLAGLGIILERGVGVAPIISVPVLALLVTFYCAMGGLFAVTWNDILQGGVAIAGFVIAFFWLSQHQPGALAGAVSSALILDEPSKLRFWATLLALALGDVVALDFMERVFAARTPSGARLACILSGLVVVGIGIIVGFMGVALHKLAPNANGNVVSAVEQALPDGIAMLFIVGLVGAGISTVDGAVMACSVAVSRNILQTMFPTLVTQLRLLAVARWTAFPIAAVATVIALVYPIPGELLVLAFDVVFAGCFVPLALGLYWKRATAEAAVYALVLPSILRVVLEVEVTRIPPEWSGIQTLVPPIVSLVLMVGLSLRKRV